MNKWRGYLRLPTSDSKLPLNSKISDNNTHSIPGLRLQVPKRYSRLLLALVIVLGLLCIFHDTSLPSRPYYPYPKILLTAPDESGLPPLFEAYTNYENHLPQQLDDNFAERKYIFMANHAYGCGWGNVLQEMIYSSLVASGSGRGFVWTNFTWNRDGPDYSEYNGKIITSRVPLSTMLSGYIPGNETSNGPRPIPKTLYEQICPPEERVYINKALVEVHRQRNPVNVGTSLDDISGKAVLEAWIDRLNEPDMKDARCVEVTKDSPQIFDIWVVGSKRVQDLWDTLIHSPIITGLSWSPIVYQAFERNRNVISPPSSSAPSESDSLPLLTLHLRRGDYANHCVTLATWNSAYTGQNSFPELVVRDEFVVPQVIEGYSSNDQVNLQKKPGDPLIVSSEEEKIKYYVKHCYPDIGQVVQRVREVVHDYETFVRDRKWRSQKHEKEDQESEIWQRKRSARRKSVGNELLKRIYIMTNGNRELLQELKQALMDDAERSKTPGETNDWEFEWTWEGISTSRDLELGWEEKPVGQVLDMYVGQRSELFIGNGFSSLTGNIVMLRMKDGRDPLQIRFW